jgi:hypothetical protein
MACFVNALAKIIPVLKRLPHLMTSENEIRIMRT